MGGFFTRDERVVMLFLVAAVTTGSLVLSVGKVDPAADGAAPAGEAAVAAGASVADGAARSDGAEPADGPSATLVDVNSAGVDELTTLPGIGPVKAREIERVRGERGPFRTLEELDDVRGIGPATLQRLRPFVTLGAATRSEVRPEARADTLETSKPEGG